MIPDLPQTKRPERQPPPAESPELSVPPAEVLPSPERERLKAEVLKEIDSAQHPERTRVAPATTGAPPPISKSPTLQAVEQVLEADLAEIYFRLEPANRQRFKLQGEVTAREIETLLLDTKQHVEQKMRRIFGLLVEWLKLLPGVNRFFIKQEAKIKTEQVMAINRDDDSADSN